MPEGFDFLIERDLALTIGCRYCGVMPGELCVTTDNKGAKHELVRFPAHPMRVARAKRLIRMRAADADRLDRKAALEAPEGYQAAKTAIEGSGREQ